MHKIFSMTRVKISEIRAIQNKNQWPSQNTEKVTHTKGRLLAHTMPFLNRVPFENGNLLKGKSEQILSFKSSSLWHGKSLFTTLGTYLECCFFYYARV